MLAGPMVERYHSFDRQCAPAQDAAQVDTGSPHFGQVPRRKRSFMPPAADAARHSNSHQAEADADLCVSQQLSAISRAVGQAEACGQQAERGQPSLSLQATAGKADAAVPRNSNETETLAHSDNNQQAAPSSGATCGSHEVRFDGQLAELPAQSNSLHAEVTKANDYSEADTGDLTSSGDGTADAYSDIDQHAHAMPNTAWPSSILKVGSDGYLEITAADPGSSSQGEADAAYPRSSSQSEAIGYQIIKQHASATLDAAAELTGQPGSLGEQHQMCQSRHALSHEQDALQTKPYNASAADEQAAVAPTRDTPQRQSAAANEQAAQQASPRTRAAACAAPGQETLQYHTAAAVNSLTLFASTQPLEIITAADGIRCSQSMYSRRHEPSLEAQALHAQHVQLQQQTSSVLHADTGQSLLPLRVSKHEQLLQHRSGSAQALHMDQAHTDLHAQPGASEQQTTPALHTHAEQRLSHVHVSEQEQLLQQRPASAQVFHLQETQPDVGALPTAPSRQFTLPHPEPYYISPQYIAAFLLA